MPPRNRAAGWSAAPDVFAGFRYDGTRVADIVAAAGVSNDTLHAHVASTADLLTAAMRYGRRALASMFTANPACPVIEFLTMTGRRPGTTMMLKVSCIEALAAARSDPAVARLMRARIGERAEWLSGLIGLAQATGAIGSADRPSLLARVVTAVRPAEPDAPAGRAR